MSPPPPPPLSRYEAGEDPALSANVTVSLAALLSPGAGGGGGVTAAIELTLPASQPLADVPQHVYPVLGGGSFTVPLVPPAPDGPGLDVTLGPMDIRTFLLRLG